MTNLLTEKEILELEAMVDNSETGEIEGFIVDDLNKLNWTFRKMSALKKRIEENKALEKAEIERIKSWGVSANKSLENSLEFFKMKIEEYHIKQLELDPKAKTISTPYGKTKSTSRKATVKELDKQQILRHVITNELPYTKPVLEWGELKKTLKINEIEGVKRVFDEDGNEVMGVGVEEAKITFGVEVE